MIDLPFSEDKIVKLKPVTFINGDNMEFLRWCKKNLMFKHFHLGIVDPPYGISVGNMMLGASSKGHKDKKYELGEWDNEVPPQEYWDLLNYVCRELIVWGGNYFVSNFGRCENDGKPSPIKDGRCFIVWDKMNDGMSFAPSELALTTYQDRNSIMIRAARNKTTVDDKGHERRHPTQKPVYLYDRLYSEFYKHGMRVLDTHGGSHTHAIAALRHGADLTIIEREKSYHADGISAYKEVYKKGRLF